MKNIKEVIRTIIKEESEYQQFFRKALEKAGKSITDMSDDEKKVFFNKIDAAWDGKGEKNEGNAFGAAVTKAKEEGDDEFTVDGKTYPVKEVVNEYDEWKNTRTQSKHIFRMLKQKYNNNISKMRDGMEDILKQNKTKNDQAEVMRDEFNKFFKIKTESVNEAKVIVRNEKTGEENEVLSGKGKGDLLIAMNALQKAAPSHMKYSIKESVNEGNSIINYNKSKYRFITWIKTDTVKNMKNRFTNRERGDSIYFFNDNGKHIATLYDKDTIYPMVKHDGSLDDNGNLKESVNENFSPSDIEKIKGAVESASSFMGIGSELKKLGMKYDFSTSPLPVYMIKKGSKTFVLVNKKYADKPDFIVNDTAGGLLESKSVNEVTIRKGTKIRTYENGKSDIVDYVLEKPNHYNAIKGGKTNLFKVINSTNSKVKVGSTQEFSTSDLKAMIKNHIASVLESKSVNETQFKSGDKVLISHPTMIKPFKGIVSTTLNAKGEEVLVLKGDKGVWDAKFAKLDEGNAFGMAVTAAKKEGKKEFEFNGKTYKIKKGSYEKNEAAKKAVTENTHVVVSMSKSGYGTLISKPVSQKDAEKLKKATTPVRGEELKVISVSDAKSLKTKLVGRELLNK